MSYDIRIADEEFNITYNVAPMFYKHNKNGIRELYNKTGRYGAEFLLDMIKFFLENKEELEKLNPKNGWGSWENTVDVLTKMLRASVRNYKDIWEGD